MLMIYMKNEENKNEEKLRLLNIQIVGSILLIASILIVITINMNQKRRLEGKEPFFTGKEEYYLQLFNRIALFVLALIFLYINYEAYNLEDESNIERRNLKAAAILASILNIIDAGIGVYIASEDEDDEEPPIIF